MVVENFVLSVLSGAYSLLMFLRPVIAGLIGLGSIILSALYYCQHKYNIFPKEVVEEIKKVDVMNFKGSGKLILDMLEWPVVGFIFIYFMYGDSFRYDKIFGVILGIAYCVFVATFVYKVLHPYLKETQT